MRYVQIIHTLFRLSSYVFLIIRTLFNFYITHKLSSSSRHFPDHLDTLHIIWILCIASGHFQNYPKILQPILNLSQKLSRFAKTFLVTRQCYPATQVFFILSISCAQDFLGKVDCNSFPSCCNTLSPQNLLMIKTFSTANKAFYLNCICKIANTFES